MKKSILFVTIWASLFAVVVGSLNLYSNSLHRKFDEKEVTCNEKSQPEDGSFSEECMIENILLKSDAERTPVQEDVVVAFRAADKFNVILLLGAILSFFVSGFISWRVVFKG